MNLLQTLSKVAELSHEELNIVRKRAEEKTKTAAHGHDHDFDEMRRAADRLDHYAQELRTLHDNEFGKNWRAKSLGSHGSGDYLTATGGASSLIALTVEAETPIKAVSQGAITVNNAARAAGITVMTEEFVRVSAELHDLIDV